MPPRDLPAEGLDADTPRVALLSGSAPTSVAEADDVAQAEARAEAARARAVRLRHRAEAASGDRVDPSRAEDNVGELDAGVAPGEEEAESTPSRRRRLHLRSRRALAIAAAVLVVCASLTTSGYLLWQHRTVEGQRHRAAEFAAAARNAVVTMMSIDASKARDDLQRFADDTTGIFKIGVLLGSQDLVKQVEDSKISSKATVQAAAVESMTKDSASVLVAAKVETAKPGQDKPDSRSLRAVVDVKRDGGKLKISSVEFVP